MRGWSAALRLDERTVRYVLMDVSGDELLRARLPARADHPRAADNARRAVAERG